MSIEQSIIEQVGGQRFLADKRQFGGLLFGLGLASMFQPLANVAAAIGPDGTTVTSGIPFSALFAGVSVIFLGLVATVVGYLQLVHDWGNKYLTGFAAFTCQVRRSHILMLYLQLCSQRLLISRFSFCILCRSRSLLLSLTLPTLLMSAVRQGLVQLSSPPL
jgi:hypothetical protein